MKKQIGTFTALVAVASGAEAQVLFDTKVGGTGSQLEHVDILGDLNGDGCNEFLYGASLDSGGTGIVHIRDGKSAAPLRIHSGVAGSYFGASSADLGDLDADGVSDYAIGAWGESSFAGSVSLFSGKTGALIKKISGAAGAQFGMAIDGIADINGDFIREIVVGAPGEAKVHLVTKSGAILKTISDSQSGSRFGAAVAVPGDMDGDGKDDLLVGAPFKDQSITFGTLVDSGSVQRFTGAGIFLSETWGGGSHYEFGNAIAGLGDLTGDGKAEFVVGAPGYASSGVTLEIGRITVLDGSNGFYLYSKNGNDAGDRLGSSVAVTPDMDGDGKPEVIAGAPGFAPDSDLGYAATFSSTTLAQWDTYSFSYGPSDRYCGVQVAGGDVNGDGIGDVMVSSPGYGWGQTDAGAAKLWLGAPAKWSHFGSGLAGSNGTPTLTVLTPPALGTTCDVWLSSSAPSTALAVVFLGFAPLDVPTSKLGHLLVDPIATLTFALPTSGLALSGDIPLDDAFANVDVFVQAWLTDPGAAKKIAFTDGLQLHLGFAY